MAVSAKRVAIVLFISCCWAGAAIANGWQHLGAVERVDKLKDGVELTCGKSKIRITQIHDGVLRVRVAKNGAFGRDFSWAVAEEPLDFKEAVPPVKVEDGKSEVKLTAGRTIVSIKKSPGLITFGDASGNALLADEPSLPMAWDGERIRVWKKMPAEESYYGLGDKPGPTDRRNRAFVMWNSDVFGWGESTDPLYKDIPFFMGLHKGVAYGVFFDNTYRSSFDFGKESPDYFSFGAEGGELNYYFFAGPEPKKVVEEFTGLIGRTPLPPLWSLGYQQSRYSYYPEARVREIANQLREKKIPADVIYLDIDYQQGNAPFTINRERFPHFEKLITDLGQQGFHVITITDLHIKKDPGHGYAPYDSGTKNDVFVKNPDGSTYVGVVWPGDSVFPDFTLSRVREWWGGLYKDFLGMGVSGFWNDMNEPALFQRADKTMPLETRHRLDDGTSLDHRAIHNVFGMENARATYEGLRKLRPDERPFVLTRAAYAGAQRYAATWTGDNSSTWNHLNLSTPMLLSLGLCGYALTGDDIGGFAGSPTADLLTRWFEVGAFNPIYRDHTGSGTADQEPWVHGPRHEAIRRRYVELRYKLLPYIYSGVEETTRTGLPFMRPVFLDYPYAEGFYGDNRDFLFGSDFFVAPVVTEMVDPEEVQLPPGAWYDFWSAQKLESKDKITLRPELEEMPVYVRAGAIVPMQPLVQSTSEKPNGPLELRVYTGSDCHGTLYEDDGHSFGYQRGELFRAQYSCQASGNAISVTSRTERNGYQPWWSSTELTVFGAPGQPKEVYVGDRLIREWHYDAQTHSFSVIVPEATKNWSVRAIF
jgi:alpha-glucosidase